MENFELLKSSLLSSGPSQFTCTLSPLVRQLNCTSEPISSSLVVVHMIIRAKLEPALSGESGRKGEEN